MLGYMEKGDNCDSLKCPHCNQYNHPRWDTEYGEPIIGDSNGYCAHCHKEFKFQTFIQYIAYPIK